VPIGYYYEGFLSIQRAVDLQIMLELGGTKARNVEVELKSFPYPPYTNDRFIVVLQLQLPFIIMLSFIVTAPVICRDVVLEKEKKLKVRTVYFLGGTEESHGKKTLRQNSLETPCDTPAIKPPLQKNHFTTKRFRQI